MEELIKSITVIVRCKRESDDVDFQEQGTGILISTNNPEYDYIITAYHCLAGSKKNRHGYNLEDITIENESLKEINIIQCYDNEDLDISIIKIEKIELQVKINIYRKNKKVNVTIISYPNSEVKKFKSEGKMRFRGKIEDFKVNFKDVILRMNSDDMNIVNNAQEKMGGCSGSGVFANIGNRLQLVGILTDIGDEENVFNTLRAVKISEIEKFISDKGLIPIDYVLDKKIGDFYEGCFKDIDNVKLKNVLLRYIDNINDFKIKNIIELIGEEIIFPSIGENYNDYTMWTSWAEFIIMMIIYSDGICGDETDDIINYLKKFRDDNTKFYYSYVNDLADIVKAIYCDDNNENMYMKCKNENNILVDFKKDGFFIKELEKEHIFKIVSNIGHSSRYCKTNRIDDPKVNKNLRFIHMNLLKDRMTSKCYCIDDNYDINNKIKEVVCEVLNND